MSDPTSRSAADWLADLAISEAQADAGEVVSGNAVLAELRAKLVRLETKAKLREELRQASSHR